MTWHHYDECPACMGGDICEDSTASLSYMHHKQLESYAMCRKVAMVMMGGPFVGAIIPTLFNFTVPLGGAVCYAILSIISIWGGTVMFFEPAPRKVNPRDAERISHFQ